LNILQPVANKWIAAMAKSASTLWGWLHGQGLSRCLLEAPHGRVAYVHFKNIDPAGPASPIDDSCANRTYLISIGFN
jgi:hypothetical protein